MTHMDPIAATAAHAAGRRAVIDPESAPKAPRTAECGPVAESEIKAALRKAGCGIVRRPPPQPQPVVQEPFEPVREWWRLATPSFKAATLGDILRVVSARTGVTIVEMQSDSRIPLFVRARMLFCFVARHIAKHSTTAIGRKINRDHSTVMHAVAKVEGSRAAFEPELGEILWAFQQKDEDQP